VLVAEASEDGKFVVLENTGYQEEKLGGWAIKRNIDGEDQVEYILDKAFSIKVASKIKIWAQGAKPATAPRWDLVASVPTWGIGKLVKTTLNNPAGEEKAVCVQQQL
jgi:hypothetical protein